MEFLTDPNMWAGFLTLTVLEIVLGIDNIIFISILAGKLPENQQAKARRLGLLGAMVTRIMLLFSLSWVMSLTQPFLTLPIIDHALSGRDLILVTGGLFLLWKSVKEIHEKIEGNEEEELLARRQVGFAATIGQIMVLDIVFSLDSVITAVGLVDQLPVMIAAVVISVAIMMAAATPVSNYVSKHPTMKMLALSFLLLIGVVLVGEGIGQHISKGYIYFAMAFAFGVEMLNARIRAIEERRKKDK
ncbi:MAG: TerC family protein [Candidatus Melainabacteria bacterium]|nr:TerC family protein [Candidatus Melainabacteria bacterium]